MDKVTHNFMTQKQQKIISSLKIGRIATTVFAIRRMNVGGGRGGRERERGEGEGEGGGGRERGGRGRGEGGAQGQKKSSNETNKLCGV